MEESPTGAPMLKLFCAHYRDDADLREHEFELYATSLCSATLTAAELLPQTAKLLRVVHALEW